MLDCYVDIHCHILPGIDDGAADLEMSQEMLIAASNDGIREIIVTPHSKGGRHNCGKEIIEARVNELQEWLDEKGISIKLYTGNEVLYRHEISNLLEEKKVFTLADSFYVLIEFYPEESFQTIRKAVSEVTMMGYYPIIAHIERYDALRKSDERVEELIELGAFMQVNANTICGKSGFGVKHKALSWIKKDYISFIASDAHDVKNRPCNLAKSSKIIKSKFGAEVERKLFCENAQRVVSNKYILRERRNGN